MGPVLVLLLLIRGVFLDRAELATEVFGMDRPLRRQEDTLPGPVRMGNIRVGRIKTPYADRLTQQVDYGEGQVNRRYCVALR